MGIGAPRARRFNAPKKALASFVALTLVFGATPSEAKPGRVRGPRPHKARRPPPPDPIRLGLPTIPVIAPPNVGGNGPSGTASDATSSNNSATAKPSATALLAGAASGKGTSTAFGSTTSAVASSGSTSGVSDSAKVGFDESRKSTDALSSVDGGGAKSKKGPGPGASGDKGPIEEFPYVWPMCIFSSPGAGNANGVTDQLVKMAAKCKVQLMVFPMFVKSTRGDGKTVAQAASAKCNADVGLKRFGVNRATALVITDDENQPAQFCGVSGVPAKDKRGCAQSSLQVTDGVKTRVANTEGLPSQESNNIAAAIVHKSATIQDFAYWSQGWAQVGRPPGPGGNRVGDWSMGYSDARSNVAGWDDDFCQDMQKSSFKNPGIKYDPKNDQWLRKPDDTGKLVDLFDRKPLWNLPAGPSKPTKDLKDPSSAGGASDFASNERSSPSAGTASDPRRGGGSASFTGGEVVLGTVTGGGGHKVSGTRPNGRGDTVRTVSGGYGNASGSATTELAGIATAGASGGSGASGGDASVVTVDRTNGGGAAGRLGPNGEQLGFDESMTANGSISTVGSSGGAASGGSVLGGGGAGGSLGGGGANGGAAAGSGGGAGLSSLDSGFFGRLNFVPLEAIRKRIPLLKGENGVLTSRERGNWGAPPGTTSEPAAPTPSRGPASVAKSDERGAKRKASSSASDGTVVNRRTQAD